MTTDLVQRPDATQHLDLATGFARLPELVEAGDTEELGRIAHTADLVRLHEILQDNKVKADEAATLKVYAEAGIGVIDIQRFPAYAAKSRAQLEISGKPINAALRATWRILGYAELQGILATAVARLAGDDQRQITTSGVQQIVRAEGAGYWQTEPIRGCLNAALDDGLTVAEIARRMGVSHSLVRGFIKGKTRAISYDAGVAYARVLGLGPDALRPVSRGHTMSDTQRKRRYKEQRREASRMRRWRARDDAVRARGGQVATVYAMVRRAEQMCTGVRGDLNSPDARAALDAAVLKLLDAAADLDQASLLG